MSWDDWGTTAGGRTGGRPVALPLSEYRQGWVRRLMARLRGRRARS